LFAKTSKKETTYQTNTTVLLALAIPQKARIEE
jgi:hypothetical protein